MVTIVEKVTAVIVTYNSAHILSQSINALKASGILKIIVVDNASSDQTIDVANSLSVHVISNTQNMGFGKAANIGFSFVETPYAYLVNPDCLVMKDSVKILCEIAESLPETALFAPLLQDDDGAVRVPMRCVLAGFLPKSIYKRVIPNGIASMQMVSGAAMFLRMNFFPHGKAFDENIFLYYEDDVLCKDIYNKGSSCVIVPNARATHIGNVSSPMTNHLQYWKGWHMGWSQKYVYQKYNIFNSQVLTLLKYYPRTLLSFIKGQSFRVSYAKGYLKGASAFSKNVSAIYTAIPE